MSLYPKLREGVVVRKITTREEVYAIVKDPIGPTYQRFESHEGDLLELFDGTRNEEAIFEELSAAHPDLPISLEYIVDSVEELRKLGLIERDESERHLVMMEKLKTARRHRFYDAENSTFSQMYFPFFDPNKMLDRVIPWIGWFWSPWFVGAWMAVFAVVLGFLMLHWNLYWAGFFELWNLPNKTGLEILGFLAVVFVVTMWHELGHGLTCKRYGGEVHDIGMMLMYLQPAFYCKIDDAYLFQNRWHRMYSTFGGAYFELMLGSVATAVWFLTPAEWWIHGLALTVTFFTGLSVIALNVNPLIRLDGYYVLMDWLEVPNLREDSFEYLGNLVKKNLLHLEVSGAPLSRRRRRIFLIYGLCTMAYTSLLILLLFHFARSWLVDWMGPAGYLMLFGLIAYFFRKRIRKGVGFIRQVWLDKRDLLRTWRARLAVLGSIFLLLILVAIPRTPTRIEGRFTVRPGERSVVKAPAQGVVQRVMVREGDTVRQDQVLAEVNNAEVEALPLLALGEMSAARREAATARALGDWTMAREKTGQAEAAKVRYSLLEGRARTLQLKAPTEGIVSTPRVQDTAGRYLEEGELFCTVDRLATVRLDVSVSERDIEEIHPGIKVRLLARAYPERPLTGDVLSIASRGRAPSVEEQALDLIKRANLFPVSIELANESGLLREGMTGRIQFMGAPRSFAGKVWWRFQRWIGELIW